MTQVLYGGGPAFTNSAGVPWTAAYVDTIGDPTCDLRSNIAAEARAKIVYERLINCTDDPGVKEALGFLMTREIAHQQSFEKALYSIQPNFPPGKLPGMPEFTNVYFKMSTGNGDLRGPWNNEPTFEVREGQPAVDGGDGHATVKLDPKDLEFVRGLAAPAVGSEERPRHRRDVGDGCGKQRICLMRRPTRRDSARRPQPPQKGRGRASIPEVRKLRRFRSPRRRKKPVGNRQRLVALKSHE